MDVLVLQDYLRCGGTEKQSIRTVDILRAKGLSADLLTFRPGGPLSNIQHTSLQKWDTHLDFYAPGLLKSVKNSAPKLVLCMGTLANCYAWYLKKHLPKTRIVTSIRTGKALNYFYRKSLRTADAVFANSFWAKQRGLGLCGPEKLFVLYNPAPLPASPVMAKVKAADEPLIFLCVQGFRKGKKQEKLISFFETLKSDASWQLWFVGTGPRESYCKKLTKHLGLMDRVRFFGFQQNVREFYEKAHVAVSASEEDSLPNFLIEAQMNGLPVIATQTGGVEETFLPKESGFLIPASHDNAFINAISQFLRDPRLLTDFSERGKNFAQALFSEWVQGEKLYQTVKGLLN